MKGKDKINKIGNGQFNDRRRRERKEDVAIAYFMKLTTTIKS